MQTHGTTPPELQFPTTEAYDQSYTAPSEVPHNLIHGGIKRRRQFFRLVVVVTALAALYHVFFEGAFVLGTVAALVAGVVLGHLFFQRMTQLS